MPEPLDYASPQQSQTPHLRWFWNIGVDVIAAVFGIGGCLVAWSRGFNGAFAATCAILSCLTVFWITGWLLLQLVVASTWWFRPEVVPIFHNPFRCLIWRVPLTAAIWLAALQVPKLT